jgi:hypothetical protein
MFHANCGFGLALAMMHGEGALNALDHLRHSSGFVGFGIGNFLHRGRADSPFVGGCLGSDGHSPDTGTQGHRLTSPAEFEFGFWRLHFGETC